MRIKLEWQDLGFDAKMRAIAKQMPWAAKDAIKQCALMIQTEERAELAKDFTIRKTAFMGKRIKIFRWPKVEPGEVYAEIGIDSKVKGGPLLLAQMEEGSTRNTKGKEGGGIIPGFVAVPLTGTKARAAFPKAVPRSLWLQYLHLRSQRARKGKGGQIIGDKGTFIVPTKRGQFVLMQRGKGGASPLYVFTRNVRLPRLMHFIRKAKALADYAMPRLFKRYMQKHLNNAH